MEAPPPRSSSFSVKRVNQSTFLMVEHDAYRELPFIYAKIHPNAPILLLCDTGCDRPDEEFKDADVTQLRPFLETYPVPELYDQPINPGGKLQYVIILSHCHYDHICGIEQFLDGCNTEIIASAAGRDFIESDLGAHSLCNHVEIPTPRFKVTHWAQSSERLTWPLSRALPGDNTTTGRDDPVDLGIVMIHTPGHTPDSLSWFDYAENTLYVGDTLYLLGKPMEPIYFPPQGDLVEWFNSLDKLANFVGRNQRYAALDDTSSTGYEPIKLSAAHTTCNVDAQRCIDRARRWWMPLIYPLRKPLGSQTRFGETFDYYIMNIPGEPLPDTMALLLPRRLVDYANTYFGE